MKNYILLLSLGLGLLATQESFAAKPAPQVCAADGYCTIRNFVPWKMYFYGKDYQFIGIRDGVNISDPIKVKPEDFPIYASGQYPYNATDGYKAEIPHCYALNSFRSKHSPYSTTRWSCGVGEENPPPQGAPPSKNSSQPAPHK